MEVRNQGGMAVIVVLILLILLIGFGATAVRLTQTEMQIASNHRESLRALYVAEAGVDLAVEWFTDPGRAPVALPIWKGTRCVGSANRPDLSTQSFPRFGLPLFEKGRLEEVRLYRPQTTEGICTVESYATTAGGAVAAVAVELGANPMGAHPLALAVRGTRSDAAVLGAHWGMIGYQGSVSLGSRIRRVPLLDPDLRPDGLPYGPKDNHDPWMTFQTAGLFLSPLPQDCPGCPQPYLSRPNLFQKAAPLNLATWDVSELAGYARRYGMHLTADAVGRLYRQGEPLGRFDDLFGGGKPAGLVLIEPRGDIDPSIVVHHLEKGFYHGYFFILGNVWMRRSPPGRTLTVQSPPWPPNEPRGERQPVTLEGVHLKGVIDVRGDLRLDSAVAVYGSVYADTLSGTTKDLLEIWYDHDHRLNRFEGQPPVYSLPGTWRELDSSVPRF